MIKSIDINCDMGEGIGNEATLMPLISSCNIACGGHAGDNQSMKEAIALAQNHQVKIGAHPSFPDKVNFGRLAMDIRHADLFSSLRHQLIEFMNVLDGQDAKLHHIKPHGALYNQAVNDEGTAHVIVELIKSVSSPVKLYAPDHSIMARLAREEQIEVCAEGFADRAYHADLRLVSRSSEGSLIENEHKVFEQVIKMIESGTVSSIEGREVPIKVDTVCVHGDHKNASRILKYLNNKLSQNNIEIR